jgi:hypothetical protein
MSGRDGAGQDPALGDGEVPADADLDADAEHDATGPARAGVEPGHDDRRSEDRQHD